jgi:hypothetical protein
MGKKTVIFVFLVVLLTGLSTAYVVVGAQAYSRYQQTTIAKQQQCGGQAPVRICVLSPQAIFSAYYPAYLTAQPQSTLFTVAYSSNTPLTLFLHVTVNGLSETQMKSVRATSTVQNQSFLPPLLKQGQVLDNLTSEFPTSLHVQVTDSNNRLYYDNDSPLTVHSRWLMQWTQANRLYIAAWVTPNAPEIDALVQQARNYLQDQPPPVPPGLIGYKGATARQVQDEVDALYDALLKSYHMKYVQETVPYVASAGSTTNSTARDVETIKLPAETLKQRVGMCIELTDVLASAVERIGLHAEIIVVPGHAFLGVSTDAQDSHVEYWDTVDMNNNVSADSANVDADSYYVGYKARGSIVDTIPISDARAAGIGPMME